jgi:phosphoglucomutase
MTLSDALDKLYETYGFYMESMIDIYMEGVNGIENRKKVMSGLRLDAPRAIGGYSVVKVGDYSKGVFTCTSTGATEPTGQPSSDVLYYVLENNDKIIVRPSGTEPKIKIYILAHGDDRATIEEKIKLYAKDARRMTEI